ncbi:MULTISPECIES: enoyl-CoA hydratase-related protein, partial [Streptacidiphilus]|uniref:Enoyl-CoA hydratase-related protein n=1 Tax=Streptacidiphilus cavernicola TaxID=3342716 RepID=A0ABV6UHR0_9ACTN
MSPRLHARRLRILVFASAFNSLTQRITLELAALGHDTAVALALDTGAELRAAVRRHDPELIVCPMLTSVVPQDVWTTRTCLIVHPGPPGDRGPSSLDWALGAGLRQWGVTVLQAVGEMDAGDIWAAEPFDIPELPGGISKSDVYRNELSDAASRAVERAVRRFAAGDFRPRPAPPGVARPYYRQEARRIDWTGDSTATASRALRIADSSPGVLDSIGGRRYFLFGGQPEEGPLLPGRHRPGAFLATRGGAVCRATADGAVWITSARPRRLRGGPPTAKAPAADALAGQLRGVPELPAPHVPLPSGTSGSRLTWSTVRYEEQGPVGLLRFSFPGGAMSTGDCRRLLAGYRYALDRPTRVLLLGASRDVFSHGIHLGAIEAAADPARESWANINAMDDVVEAVLNTRDRITVAALGGNAAAGGLMLALAADEVWVRDGAVLNPHYRLMGLYGSEYWTSTLPRRVGPDAAERLTGEALPLIATQALRLGLIDRVLGCAPQRFTEEAAALGQELAGSADWPRRLAAKRRAREHADAQRPLAWYRSEELAHMYRNFYAPDEPYHELRRAFLHKTPPPTTPERLRRVHPTVAA